MPDIMHLLTIKAPADQVYQALATQDGVRNWWARDTQLDATEGGRGRFAFNDCQVVTTVRIDELEPASRVAWTVLESPAPGGWPGTTISFGLEQVEGGTKLRFAHRGFAKADDGYAIVTTGWAYFMVSLKYYVETGTGAPHPDVDFSRVIS